MKNLKLYASIYYEFFKQNLKVMIEYRVDFIIGALSTIATQLGGVLFVWVIFQNIDNINGWSFYEIIFIYGLLTTCKGINHIFFDDLWTVGNKYIREGSFDIILLRPIRPLFHIVANKVQRDGVGDLLIGIVLISKAIHKLQLNLDAIKILELLFFIAIGSAIIVAINVITCTLSFWTINSTSYMWAIFSLNEFALYPINIFHPIISVVVSWIVPYAFASFYPATYFLNKSYSHLSMVSPIIAIILWIIALRFWKIGIKNYSSTGC